MASWWGRAPFLFWTSGRRPEQQERYTGSTKRAASFWGEASAGAFTKEEEAPPARAHFVRSFVRCFAHHGQVKKITSRALFQRPQRAMGQMRGTRATEKEEEKKGRAQSAAAVAVARARRARGACTQTRGGARARRRVAELERDPERDEDRQHTTPEQFMSPQQSHRLHRGRC